MAETDGIASAGYLIDGYVEAHDELAEHLRTESPVALQRAAAALCHVLTRLGTDDRFWDDFARVERAGPEPEAMDNLDALLGVERGILIEAGVPEAAAEQIIREAASALNDYADWPDRFGAERVRDAMKAAARAACIEASFYRRPIRAIPLGRAVRAGAGGVIVVANGLAAPPGIRELSVVIGGRVKFSSKGW
jgi:hypothetical protein